MKKLLALTLALLLLLCACASPEPSPTEPPTEIPTAAPTAAPTEVPTDPPTEPPTVPETTVPEKPEAAFAGYQQIHETEREKAWEADIIYLARLYLGELVLDGHPILAARRVSIMDVDNTVYQRYFYDSAIRDAFVRGIKDLIPRLPELNDAQIVYELKRIVALIGDAHSDVYGNVGHEWFPFAVEQMEHNGEVGLYLVRILDTPQKLIYSKLVSVNGIPVDEVVARLEAFVPMESEYWVRNNIFSIFNSMLIADKVALQAAGIVDWDADTAVFSFEDSSGQIHELEMEALDSLTDEYWDASYVERTPYVMGFLSYEQYGDASYFYRYLYDYDTLFIRLYDFTEDTDYRLSQMFEQIRQDLRSVTGLRKIVVDVRDNPGGYTTFVDQMTKFLQEFQMQDIYVLTDEGSFSAATIFPNRIRSKFENATIVGTPTGQSPNFFAGITTLNMRTHDVTFTMSTSYFEGDPSFTEDSLMPDLLIYQSLVDYKKGIDTVLQTVLEMD